MRLSLRQDMIDLTEEDLQKIIGDIQSDGLPISPEDVEKADQLDKARNSLQAFTELTMPEYQTNWHHKIFCEHLDKFARGEIKRLMVFCPPRNGKSELISRRFPAYMFGRNPDISIISCSYGADLASRMNRDVQRIMSTETYQEIFPETKLWDKNVRSVADGSYLRNSEIFEIVNHKGVYRCAGVGGGITGMGGKLLLLDDAIKNAEEANSKVYRDKVWEWYTSTFFTRLEKDGGICVTLTRWHDDDVAGRLLKLPDADEWTVINLPAIAEEDRSEIDPRQPGEALWPAKYDEKDLAAIKTAIGIRDWNALYQQRPTSASGGIFKKSWWRYYLKEDLPHKFDKITISMDAAFKKSDSSDFVAIEVWGKWQQNHYLLEFVNERLSFTDSVYKLAAIAMKYPDLVEALIEDKANGTAIIDTLKAKIPCLVPITPKESKEARAQAIAPVVEAGNVYLPDESEYPEIKEFVSQMSDFPKSAHDDLCDSFTQYLNRDRSGASWVDALASQLDKIDQTSGISPQLQDMFWGNR